MSLLRPVPPLLTTAFAIALLAACSSSSSEGGTTTSNTTASGAGGGATTTTTTTSAGGGGSTTSTSAGSFTHCPGSPNHCIWAGQLFACAEYGEADAATYEGLCKDGGGTWSAGGCDETGVLGVCLANGYCAGMGIGFVTDAAQLAAAKESCASTGGTWQDPK